MQRINEAISASEAFEKYSKRRVRRRSAANVIRFGAVAAGVGLAGAFHAHPEVMQAIPQVVDSVANTIHLPDALHTIKNVSDGVGGFMNNFPILGYFTSFLPHLAETHTPVGEVINQQGLTTIEASLAFEGIRGLQKRRKQKKREKVFMANTNEMKQIKEARKHNQSSISLLQQKEGRTIFGNRLRVMEKVLANPYNFWNKKRIVEALRTTLVDTLNASKAKANILETIKNPRIWGQAGAEILEQSTRFGVALHHLGKVALESAGFFFWLPSFAYSVYEGRKKGQPEVIKSSLMQLPAIFLPLVGGILYAIAVFPFEMWLKKHLGKINKYLVAGLEQDLLSRPKNEKDAKRKKFITGLVKESLNDKAAQDEKEKLPTTVQTLEADLQNSPLLKGINDRINVLQTETNGLVAEYRRRQRKNILSRTFHARGIRKLASSIEANQAKTLALMHSTLGKESEEAQLARALATIYQVPVQPAQ